MVDWCIGIVSSLRQYFSRCTILTKSSTHNVEMSKRYYHYFTVAGENIELFLLQFYL